MAVPSLRAHFPTSRWLSLPGALAQWCVSGNLSCPSERNKDEMAEPRGASRSTVPPEQATLPLTQRQVGRTLRGWGGWR